MGSLPSAYWLFLGNLIPNVDKYLIPIILLIVIASIAPSAIHLIRERKADNELKEVAEEVREEVEVIVKK